MSYFLKRIKIWGKLKISYSIHIAMLHYAQGGAQMATILIVEDDIDTNEAVCEYLQDAGHTTIPALDGDEAITLFAENKIDLVVLDIMLPTITGLAVLNSIRKTSQVLVLMLTAMEDEQTQIASFDGQADDYMTKPFSMVILGKRVAALLRRSNLAEKVNVWTCGDLTVNFSGYSVHDSNGELEVTAKELDLLKLLVEHKGLVLSRAQILDGVWGDNSYVLDRLVDTYIKNLRKKLHLKRSKVSDINLRSTNEKAKDFPENVPLYFEPDVDYCPAFPYADLLSDAVGL